VTAGGIRRHFQTFFGCRAFRDTGFEFFSPPEVNLVLPTSRYPAENVRGVRKPLGCSINTKVKFMFFLVSGATASGKSTVAKNLPSQLENLVCHDYDERKVTDEYTRCQQLEEWVQLALNHQQEGRDFLLTSHSPFGELLACPSARNLAGISACLLDCSDPNRIQRMRKRGFDPRWPPTQDVLNWASWHRMHAWDPQWEQRVIIGNGPFEHSYDCWIHWKQNDKRWQVRVIDTTATDVELMLDRVATWVKSEREKVPLLTLDTKWWK